MTGKTHIFNAPQREGMSVVIGEPGTGKQTGLKAARKNLEEIGRVKIDIDAAGEAAGTQKNVRKQ